METRTIEDLFSQNQPIQSQDLRQFLNNKLTELYDREKQEPLFDYAQIRYSAMIDLVYEMMPTLREELDQEQELRS